MLFPVLGALCWWNSEVLQQTEESYSTPALTLTGKQSALPLQHTPLRMPDSLIRRSLTPGMAASQVPCSGLTQVTQEQHIKCIEREEAEGKGRQLSRCLSLLASLGNRHLVLLSPLISYGHRSSRSYSVQQGGQVQDQRSGPLSLQRRKQQEPEPNHSDHVRPSQGMAFVLSL